MEFKNYHPIINFIYFAAVITFGMFIMHPAFLVVSFLCSVACLVTLRRKTAAKFVFFLVLPIIIISAVLNPLFNHGGITIITYMPSGNPFTLESVLYGFASGTMIAAAICWFSCMSAVLTSDKIIYLFGRIIPALSLIFSMALKFIPEFTEQIKRAFAARPKPENEKFISKIRRSITVLSAAVTWALENSIDTADSMKSRGYGLPGRTSFSVFKFSRRDIFALIYTLLLIIYILSGMLGKAAYFRYFPSVKYAEISFDTISMLAAYFLLCIMPCMIELWETKKWKSLK